MLQHVFHLSGSLSPVSPACTIPHTLPLPSCLHLYAFSPASCAMCLALYNYLLPPRTFLINTSFMPQHHLPRVSLHAPLAPIITPHGDCAHLLHLRASFSGACVACHLSSLYFHCSIRLASLPGSTPALACISVSPHTCTTKLLDRTCSILLNTVKHEKKKKKVVLLHTRTLLHHSSCSLHCLSAAFSCTSSASARLGHHLLALLLHSLGQSRTPLTALCLSLQWDSGLLRPRTASLTARKRKRRRQRTPVTALTRRRRLPPAFLPACCLPRCLLLSLMPCQTLLHCALPENKLLWLY